MDQNNIPQSLDSSTPALAETNETPVKPSSKSKLILIMISTFFIVSSIIMGFYIIFDPKLPTLTSTKQIDDVLIRDNSVSTKKVGTEAVSGKMAKLTSKECLLSLEYPVSFKAESAETYQGACVIKISDPNNSDFRFYLMFFRLTWKEILDKYPSSKQITVGGSPGIEVVPDSSQMEIAEYVGQVFFNKGNKVYSLAYSKDPKNPEMLKTIENIQNSIQFTGSASDYNTAFADPYLNSMSEANNVKRKSDLNAIMNAIGKYAADNKGELPSEIETTNMEIASSFVNLCKFLVPNYISGLPVDPTTSKSGSVADCSTSYMTGYMISKSGDSVTVSAPNAELGEKIIVTR